MILGSLLVSQGDSVLSFLLVSSLAISRLTSSRVYYKNPSDARHKHTHTHTQNTKKYEGHLGPSHRSYTTLELYIISLTFYNLLYSLRFTLLVFPHKVQSLVM